MPVGIVLRRAPGVTRWAAWVWTAVDALPGAGAADWRLLREEGGVSFHHAATWICICTAPTPKPIFTVWRRVFLPSTW